MGTGWRTSLPRRQNNVPSVQPCCLSSAAWHLFINHRSERAARLANVADILGVWVAGGGTYVPVFAYGLYCHQVVWNKWFSTYMMLFPFMLATYTVKFPERFWPGKFDYVGQSHTLWHCLYIYALYCWHSACWEFADVRQTHPCQVR
uniref:Uncharacterized protein n=1 Tax=Branchiostoma floridae TaxID=7739 RepID=C3ZPH3_BRAFL|eukprot:XP_002589531.1 hypothetical protein BRAFLDRAFT_97030 [Branchiostoma floridae]